MGPIYSGAAKDLTASAYRNRIQDNQGITDISHFSDVLPYP